LSLTSRAQVHFRRAARNAFTAQQMHAVTDEKENRH
jgi:hypothetical protein